MFDTSEIWCCALRYSGRMRTQRVRGVKVTWSQRGMIFQPARQRAGQPLAVPLGRAHAMVERLTDRLPSDACAGQAGLTSREREVLDLIRRGLISDREIAEVLQVSPATAATHVQRILRKTGLHNRRDLMLLSHAKFAA
jgi:DNA-binding CsgD family transcriptional regulator